MSRVAPANSPGTTGQEYMIQEQLVGGVSRKVLLPVLAVSSSPVITALAETASESDKSSTHSLEIDIPTETAKQKKGRLFGLRQAW